MRETLGPGFFNSVSRKKSERAFPDFNSPCGKLPEGICGRSISAPFQKYAESTISSMLEKLHFALVLLCARQRLKRAQIPSLAGFRIGHAGIKPILAGFEFADHIDNPPSHLRSRHVSDPSSMAHGESHEAVSRNPRHVVNGEHLAYIKPVIIFFFH
jgi:hypothetical protein